MRVEPLEVDYIDGMLLLPLIIEHTVDERSPLCGHTHQSLSDMNAEIVVTFEGTTEVRNRSIKRCKQEVPRIGRSRPTALFLIVSTSLGSHLSRIAPNSSIS